MINPEKMKLLLTIKTAKNQLHKTDHEKYIEVLQYWAYKFGKNSNDSNEVS